MNNGISKSEVEKDIRNSAEYKANEKRAEEEAKLVIVDDDEGKDFKYFYNIDNKTELNNLFKTNKKMAHRYKCYSKISIIKNIIINKLRNNNLNDINGRMSFFVDSNQIQSKIEGTDFAAVTLTKNQILSQAATTMLAQANDSKQIILS